MLVKDIAGLADRGSYPYGLTNVGGTLYFSADDGKSGEELWKSDGTPAGTQRVKDIRPGPDGSDLDYLIDVDGTLFFTADDGVHGLALWKSDGTEAGTVLVKSLGDASYYSYLSFTSAGGVLYFTLYDDNTGEELWKSDGTEAGTKMVKDIRPGNNGYYPYGSYPRYLTNVGGVLYFTADDGIRGQELWKSDGTAAGTVRVKDIQPGAYGSYPYHLTNVNGTLFFSADDGTVGSELWKSDGTPAGTVRVKDIDLGQYGSYPYNLTNVGGILFFTADDGMSGHELWKSDGTAAGTVLVKDVEPGVYGSFPKYLTDVGGTLYFFVGDRISEELWKSDGTKAGTLFVAELQTQVLGRYGSDPGRQPTNVGGTLFFVANIAPNLPPPCPRCAPPPGDSELWSSDGTGKRTLPAADIRPGEEGSQPRYLTAAGGLLFFTADDGIHGNELWVVTPDEPPREPGDTDGDRDVDIDDLNNVRNTFGCTLPAECAGDADSDGDTDIDDLNAVRNNFGVAPVAAVVAAESPAPRHGLSDGVKESVGVAPLAPAKLPTFGRSQSAADVLFGVSSQLERLWAGPARDQFGSLVRHDTPPLAKHQQATDKVFDQPSQRAGPIVTSTVRWQLPNRTMPPSHQRARNIERPSVALTSVGIARPAITLIPDDVVVDIV